MHLIWRSDFVWKWTKIETIELSSWQRENSVNQNYGTLERVASLQRTDSYARLKVRHAWSLTQRKGRAHCPTSIRSELADLENWGAKQQTDELLLERLETEGPHHDNRRWAASHPVASCRAGK